jgi:hypothetical protein
MKKEDQRRGSLNIADRDGVPGGRRDARHVVR